MSAIEFPFKPRREDPTGFLTVQDNLENLAGMFDRGINTGDVPTWDAATSRYIAAPGVAVPSVGTAFPSSPVNLQEAIIMDSLTTPTYAWRFIYLSGISDSYKWVCFGPSAFQHRIVTEENVGSSATWVNLSTDGPKFTVTFPGIYDCYGQANGVNTAGSAQGANIGLVIGNNTPSEDIPFTVPSGGRQIATLYKQLTAAASDVIKIRYRTSATTNFDFGYRVLRIVPVRVSA